MQADVDGDGTLNYGEFVAVSVHIRKMANDEHLHKAFSFFDKNKTGFIEVDELRDALNEDSDAVTNVDEVINAIMHDVDTDKVRDELHACSFDTCILELLHSHPFLLWCTLVTPYPPLVVTRFAWSLLKVSNMAMCLGLEFSIVFLKNPFFGSCRSHSSHQFFFRPFFLVSKVFLSLNWVKSLDNGNQRVRFEFEIQPKVPTTAPPSPWVPHTRWIKFDEARLQQELEIAIHMQSYMPNFHMPGPFTFCNDEVYKTE